MILQILNKLYEKGLPITGNVSDEIKSILGENCSPRISELLDKLSTEELELELVEKENIWQNKVGILISNKYSYIIIFSN